MRKVCPPHEIVPLLNKMMEVRPDCYHYDGLKNYIQYANKGKQILEFTVCNDKITFIFYTQKNNVEFHGKVTNSVIIKRVMGHCKYESVRDFIDLE